MIEKLPNHTALKEWSNVIEALGKGEQIVLIRKGGLADPHFGVEADRFYLYPTYFHQGETEAATFVEVTHWCELVRSWKVAEHAMLSALESFVVIPRETLETRYRFRPDQALFVLAVRVWALPRPARVKFRDEYAGCRSWISVDEEISVEGSVAVLTESELASRVASVHALLAATV